MNKEFEHVYAIIRSDDFLGDDCPTEEKITVKMVVWNREEANLEVSRLNALQKPNGPRYFSTVTRLIKQQLPASAVQGLSNGPLLSVEDVRQMPVRSLATQRVGVISTGSGYSSQYRIS